MSRITTTGVAVAAGANVPNRREINDLVKDKYQFSLYVQALAAMSAQNQTDVTSFFQIAGIHGLPYVQWDGSGGTKPVAGSQWGGYCTHGSVLFPTWHRPYVALFEQFLHQHAVAIAATYTTEQSTWKNAADTLRAPYWDWASNSVPPDEVIQDKQVTIAVAPTGASKAVTNPLFGYVFHPIDKSFPAPYSHWGSTLRYPTSSTSSAQTDVAQLKSDLAGVQDDITSSTYNMLTRVHTWPAFSNHSQDDGGSSSNSLEGIHDGIHVDVGGGGQMSDPAVAGFDPMFFLHHCNVDRMLSLWSALNPGVWITTGPAEGGTFTISGNAKVGATTDLTPFWETQSSYWLSSQTKTTDKTFGYTYPEFNGLDMSNPTAVKTAIAQKVNQLYSGMVFNTASTAASAPPAAAQAPAQPVAPAPTAQQVLATTVAQNVPAASSATQHASSDLAPPHAVPVHHAPGSSYLDWATRIHVKKYALGGSFSVLIFLGPVPENPREWRSSDSFVGGHHAFVNSAAEHCENCSTQSDEQMVIEGFVHLNKAIMAKLHRHHGTLEPHDVEPLLKEKLSWRIQRTVGRQEVPVAEVPSLEILVSATLMTFKEGHDLPSHGTPHYYPEITAGKPGGAPAEHGN